MTNYFFLNLFSSLLLCVYLLVIKTRSLWWWQWMGKQGGEEEGRMTSTSRFTSRLARRTLGTMWGRQRPSISITLSSLSAIRDTWEQEGHYILFFLNLLLFFFFFKICIWNVCSWPLLLGGCRSTFCRRTTRLAGRPEITSWDTTKNKRPKTVTTVCNT